MVTAMTRYLLPAFVAMFLPAAAFAEPLAFSDPANDYLSTYTGPQNGDLDVLTFDATFDGTTFTFSQTSNGTVGTTPGGIFVWGVNRGGNTAGFGAFRPGVLFDSVVIADPGGNSAVVVSGVRAPLTPSATTVSGNMISVAFAASLLPSNGFAPGAYQVNLWPRNGLGNNAQISDFAPDNSDVTVRTVPEPASLALMLVGLMAAGACRRKQN